MNGKSKTVKLSVMLILMIALMFSTAFMMIIKATEDTDKGKEAKFDGDYTIEYLIRHFNLVTLQDVSQVEHIVGPVLIGGDVKCNNLCHSQKTGGTSSYIKGKIDGGNVSCNDEKKPTLYLGTKSGAKVSENGGGTTINNDTFYTNSPTVITDDYLNFDTLFNKIKSQSKSIVSGKKVTKRSDNSEIEINIGDTVIIESLDGVSNIRMTGDNTTDKITLINITASGEVTLPQLWINENQARSEESDEKGHAIVWNFPNATAIKMADSASVGHIVAPNADIEAQRTNYAGCLIGKSLDGPIEGHFYTYSGTKIPLKEVPKEEPKEEPKDKNNTTQNNTTKPSNNTTGNNTTASKNNTTKPSNNTTGNTTTASKNNTTKPSNNTTGNTTTTSKNNTTKPSNNTIGNSTTESKNNTTKPKNNTTGNSTTESKNNTTKPKNNTTGNSTTASKNNTTKNNVAVASKNKTNKNNTSKNEDGMVLGAEWEKNNTSKNKTDKTTANGKLPQTGDEFSQKIVLAVVMIALVVVFGAKYIKHKNELDANK